MLISNNKSCIKILIILLILVNVLTIEALAIVKPTNDFYVNDYAKLLDTETKQYIISTNKNLYKKTGSQIVVVTIESLEGNSLEDYATKLFRNFGIGDKNKNNGILLLLSLKERKFRIEVGYGLEGILPDAKTGRIQDEYIIPYLKNNKWNEGIRNGFNAILNVIANEYNVEVGGEKAVKTTTTDDTNNTSIIILPFIFSINSFIVGMILRILSKKKKIKKINVWIISIIYIVVITIICIFAIKNVIFPNEEIFGDRQYSVLNTIIIFNLVAFLTGILENGGEYWIGGSSGRSSSSGGSSGGGSSGGGGSSRGF
ncbi:MAG: TPM domain-containing protein [Clostridia bacterium]|nr:TPM domain-containing protein [Clostridia bacterium]